MDFLQIALIFLIALLTIFLTVTGMQVFYILKDLKKALNKLNTILYTEETKEKLVEYARKNSRTQKNPHLFRRVK